MKRRAFIAGSGIVLADALVACLARAKVPSATDRAAFPPTDSRENFLNWMEAHRGEERKFLDRRWNRCQSLLNNGSLVNARNMRAFLLTPREEFVLAGNAARAYGATDLDIGYGVVISSSALVARMTSAIDVQPDDKVLEIGTGSGYQSAYLSNLTERVWTIEIIQPLFDRTRGVYDGLVAQGYGEYSSIACKAADGYYGWEQAAPFDKVIVTCGIDHIPPPILQQLKPGGIMVIPIGSPGAQRVLKVVKQPTADGSFTVSRSDIFNGGIFAFVPFTKLDGNSIKGTHFRSN